MLRARILEAMVLSVGERGFGSTTISDVCGRAQISRRTFYETFDGLQDCFLAVIEDGHRRVHELISEALECHEHWLDGMRAALMSILMLVDEEPLLARVWLVEALATGSWALERRERHITALTDMILKHWPVSKDVQLNPLAAAGVLELSLGILHTRLLVRSEEPMIGLLGPLMGLIAAVYLAGPVAAVEIERGNELTRVVLAKRQSRPNKRADSAEVPGLLRDPRAHRARRCMLFLLRYPGASNRQVATAVGITRPAQVSRLLTRLCALGLLVKHQGPRGGANAWSLTPLGVRVADVLES